MAKKAKIGINEARRRLKASTTNQVREWADTGKLACIRNAKGEREFDPDDVERFRLARIAKAQARLRALKSEPA